MNRKWNKKMIAILLMCAMLFTLVPAGAFAAEEFEVDNVKYKILTEDSINNKWTVEVSGYTGTAASVTIPATVVFDGKTYAVTSIGDNAFHYCTNLTSITIPDSVISIGNTAFSGCTCLSSITFGENSQLQTIGQQAFNGCYNLGNVSIPNSVTTIGDHAFYGCDKLTSITFGENSKLTSIGNYAFADCDKLESIVIPASVTSIGNRPFNSCSSLKAITFGKNSQLESIDEEAFSGLTGLTSIAIPASVTSIGDNAFKGCTTMSSITFVGNSKLTTIGDQAFSGCTSLTGITIPDSVTSIGLGTFNNCTSLKNIIIPDGVTSIGNTAFYECISLKSITIPASVTSIGMSTFQGCTGLTGINIPEGVTSIGIGAFNGCEKLDNVNIPASVTSIGSAAFHNCTSLTSITIPASVTSIGAAAFADCTELTSITIPASVTNIDKDAFAGCTALKNVNVPCNWDGSLYDFGTGVTVNREEHKDKNSDYACDICGEAVGSRPSSGGGFSGSYNYPVKADNVDGADVSLSDSYAVKGETVTITVKPEAGKQVSEVIVTDADGKAIPVTKVDDNQYTFTMPAGKVNIAVTTEAAEYDLRIVMQINNKNIVANNRTITNDVAPVIVGDRTLVPVRVVTELLGGTAHWDNDTRTVTLKIDGKVLTMTIGKEIPGFGTSAVILNSRTYVPIRYVMEMLGAEVTWIQATQQIIIEK